MMNRVKKTLSYILLLCCICLFLTPPTFNRFLSSVKTQLQVSTATACGINGGDIPSGVPTTNNTNNEEDHEDDENKASPTAAVIFSSAGISSCLVFVPSYLFVLQHIYQEVMVPPPNSSLSV